MRTSALKSRHGLTLLLSFVIVAVAASSSFAAAPLLRGELGVEMIADKDGVEGFAELSMTLDIGLSGAHRARVSVGSVAGKRARLGSANSLWSMSHPVTVAYLEHTGSFTDGGQRVRTRLGDVFIDFSRNIAYVEKFQGLRVTGFTLGSTAFDVAYGWNPSTASSPYDTLAGVRADGRLLGTDYWFVVLNSDSLQTNLMELGLGREIAAFDVDALFMDNGEFNAYQFKASVPVRTWKLSGTYTDWGAFDTPYTGRGDTYLWYKYNGKYNVKELELSGSVRGVDLTFGLLTYDDLMDIQRRFSSKAEWPVRTMKMRHDLEIDQNLGRATKNKLSLEGTTNVRNWLRNVDWGVSWDAAANEDAFAVKATYTAPNRITFTAEHKSDSGASLKVASKLSF